MSCLRKTSRTPLTQSLYYCFKDKYYFLFKNDHFFKRKTNANFRKIKETLTLENTFSETAFVHMLTYRISSFWHSSIKPQTGRVALCTPPWRYREEPTKKFRLSLGLIETLSLHISVLVKLVWNANIKQLLLHGAEWNIGNIFRVSHIFQLLSSAFRRVKLYQNMRNKVNICQYCTRKRAITTLSLNACLH